MTAITSTDHLISQQKTTTAAASLPSPPPLSTPEAELVSLPSPPPVQLVSLLPPLSIPSTNNNNKAVDALLTPPASARSPPLLVQETEPQKDDALPWLNHPHSLANTNTATKSHQQLESSLLQPQLQQRRHRQYRNHHNHNRPQLPDPALASQLLSTISSKDLARLYVHAAHHLHSHQPIRRYVMMKMIMTQAELAQYGRLRAEMPRAPGPSTGAQPKRNGFGSPARSGFAFMPKNPSKLGRYMYSAAAFVVSNAAQTGPAARWGTAGRACRSWSMEEEDDMDIEVWSEKPSKKKSTRLPWTQSLSSLVLLTKRSTPLKSATSVSEPNLYCSSRRLEELELGGGQHDHHHSRRVNTSSSSAKQQQQSPSSRIRRRGGGGRVYSEDDYDDGEPSEDTETGDDFEGEEEDDFDDEDLDGHEAEVQEKPRNYWTMLRNRTTTTNNSTRKRDLRTSSDQHLKEARIHLNMQQDKEHQQYLYQQQQRAIPLQQLDPQVVMYTSSTKPSSTSKPKSHARRRTALSHSNNGSPSGSPYSSPNSSSSESNNPLGLSSSSSTTSGAILPAGGAGSAASFTETYGVSGLLMLSLFFVFLFLLEGTNQFYKVQSALLSIIL
ncbi:hypothetical protein EC991_009241 [Linnemannia zychae]|nr:hypothetical protein EC991_009241 [Linnemannia zychae]